MYDTFTAEVARADARFQRRTRAVREWFDRTDHKTKDKVIRACAALRRADLYYRATLRRILETEVSRGR